MSIEDKTIRTVPEERCTGCGACYNRCPVGAITMEYNAEGFLFPRVNEELCIQCGACQGACPEMNLEKVQERIRPHQECYAAMAADEEMRLSSSSGGLFTLLAQAVYEQGGAVCGAIYGEGYQTVHHIISTSPEDLPLLRGSKYVQSDMQLVYQAAEQELKKGVPVLFTGCPCQVAGLYTFLGKDYEKLYTVDLVCHGANSTFAYQSYLKEVSHGKEIKSVNFRDKSVFGWSTPTTVYFEDGSVMNHGWDKSKWNEGFLGGIINRKCCSTCHYAQNQRIGDITLGDFWQVHRWDASCNDWKGTSLVLVNTAKGENLYLLIGNALKLNRPAPFDVAVQYNGQLRNPAPQAPGRQYFFNHLSKDGYHKSLWYGHRWRYDVGLIGWWFAANYGSVLTYYSLGKLIEAHGMLPILIRVPNFNSTQWEPITEKNIAFMEKYFFVSKTRQFAQLHECNIFCDAFVVGSDQLWVQNYCKMLGYTFFLDFVDEKHKKLAYATSMGHAEYKATQEEKNIVSMLLARFDGISVREDSGVDICRKEFGVEAERRLDPVFLCDVQHYDNLAKEASFKATSISLMSEPFIFCYMLDLTDEKRDGLHRLEEKLGMKSIVVLDLKKQESDRHIWEGENIFSDVGVEEFVYLIKNSAYVYTDSHHGVCFSMIYHKPFTPILNPWRGKARFTSLFKIFNMENLLIEEGEILGRLENIEAPDYAEIDRIMEREKQESLAWLYGHLDQPKSKDEVPSKEDLFARYFNRVMRADHPVK